MREVLDSQVIALRILQVIVISLPDVPHRNAHTWAIFADGDSKHEG